MLRNGMGGCSIQAISTLRRRTVPSYYHYEMGGGCQICREKHVTFEWPLMRASHKCRIQSSELLIFNHRVRERGQHLSARLYPFFLPPQSQPFIMPVIPPAAAFWVCSLSSIDGNSTRLRATSKNSGLHGTGSKLGGNWVKFGLFVVTFGSSVYSSSRSHRGCKVNKTFDIRQRSTQGMKCKGLE